MLFIVFGEDLLLKYLGEIPLKYRGLISGQFAARCTDRKNSEVLAPTQCYQKIVQGCK